MKNPIAKNFLFETKREMPIRSGIATTMPAAIRNEPIPISVTKIPLNEVRVPRKSPIKKLATG